MVEQVLADAAGAEPDWRVTIRSTIPVASGLGSGAAVSAALIRGLAAAAGRTLPPEAVSALAYEVEKLHRNGISPFRCSDPVRWMLAGTGVLEEPLQ